jgi:phage terminase small subunit
MIAARIGQLRALGSELGLDPSSRTRLATGPELDPDDPVARYLGPKIG